MAPKSNHMHPPLLLCITATIVIDLSKHFVCSDSSRESDVPPLK